MAERKKAETALHRINGDLEQLVADRTANLVRANTQLKGEFSKRLQHEKRLKTYHAKLRSLSSELLLAEERERRRIATELHDHIGQTLTISKLKIDALCESIQAPESARELEAVGRLIEQSIQDARTLTFELSPPVLYVLGLESALEWLAEKFQKQHRLVIVLEDDEKPKPLGDATKVLMFQSCRELLFNIVKHAGAQNVKLTLKRIENNFRLDVVDDGGGFDPTRVLAFNHRDCGFGLFSIRERLHHHGGRLEIHSTPGKGARMALICPLEQSQISQPRVEVAL